MCFLLKKNMFNRTKKKNNCEKWGYIYELLPNLYSPFLLSPPCCRILIFIVIPWHPRKHIFDVNSLTNIATEICQQVCVCVCYSLMVSGFRGRSWGGSCPWCHKQLPEVVISQFGPENTRMVNKHAFTRSYGKTNVFLCQSDTHWAAALWSSTSWPSGARGLE